MTTKTHQTEQPGFNGLRFELETASQFEIGSDSKACCLTESSKVLQLEL